MKTSFIPSYYAANVERLARFAMLHVENTRTAMNENEINARRAANEFVNVPTHRVNTVDKHGNEMSCPAWGLDMAEAIAADRRAEFPNDTTEIVATGATEYENEVTNIPEFSDLTHAATNIVLAAENTQSIYAAHVEPLLRSLERKAAKGVTLSLDTLAKSYAMAAIVRESIKEVKRTSYDPFSANADDRRAAALYLANIYIGDL